MEVNGVPIQGSSGSQANQGKRVGEVNGVPVVEAPTGEKRGTSLVGENFDNFLTLLTTQLQHQDPLSPLDTTEFTNQLTNFAQVEQAINSNKKLDQLIALQGGSQLGSGMSYMGKLVEAPGDVMQLQDGHGRIGYELSGSSARTTIALLDSNNNVVGFFEGSTQAGQHVFDWDGTDENGDQLPDGSYKVLVTALDGENNAIDSSTTTFGKVTGVEIDDGALTLLLGSLSVDIADVKSVHEVMPEEDA